MRTIVYVDGFNLYFRLLRDQPGLKWLNLKNLIENILDPTNELISIKYYTARVSGKFDPTTPQRQQAYLDALSTIPEISIYYGMFLSTKKWSGLIHPPQFRPSASISEPWPDVVRTHKFEEKGSDVNLATHLLADAFRDSCEVAVVISNDSDLTEPIRIARHELGKIVGLVSPVQNPNPQLSQHMSFVRRIRASHLAASQFPDTIEAADGRLINKPASWN